MQGRYVLDHDKEKKYLKENMRLHTSYRIIRLVVPIVAIVCPIILIALFLINEVEIIRIENVAVWLFVGIILSIVIYGSMKTLYEIPYCLRWMTKLVINDDFMDYCFDDVRENRSRYSRFYMYVYRIEYNKISNIEYDPKSHILYITGHAENIEYKDFRTMELSKVRKLGEYNEKTRFGFILALENNNEKEFVEFLKQKAGFAC